MPGELHYGVEPKDVHYDITDDGDDFFGKALDDDDELSVLQNPKVEKQPKQEKIESDDENEEHEVVDLVSDGENVPPARREQKTKAGVKRKIPFVDLSEDEDRDEVASKNEPKAEKKRRPFEN